MTLGNFSDLNFPLSGMHFAKGGSMLLSRGNCYKLFCKAMGINCLTTSYTNGFCWSLIVHLLDMAAGLLNSPITAIATWISLGFLCHTVAMLAATTSTFLVPSISLSLQLSLKPCSSKCTITLITSFHSANVKELEVVWVGPCRLMQSTIIIP